MDSDKILIEIKSISQTLESALNRLAVLEKGLAEGGAEAGPARKGIDEEVEKALIKRKKYRMKATRKDGPQ